MTFPLNFSVQELENMEKYSLWQQGNRAINHLHRSAREQMINTLLVQRFHTDQEKKAMLVAGWKENIRDTAMLAIVEDFMQMFEYGTSLFVQKAMHSQIQEETSKTQEVLTFLQENIDEGVVTLDHEKAILDINQNMERLLGYSKWEAQALSLDSYLVADPKVSDLFHDEFERKAEIGENQLTLRRRDGEAEPVKMRVIPCDENNPTTQFLVLIQSTREVDGLRKNLKELEHQAALGKSVATFAHEVRNPINNMVTGLQCCRACGRK
jgi:PAS domain S-box-containing protein